MGEIPGHHSSDKSDGDDDQVPQKPLIDAMGSGDVGNDFSELPMIAQKHRQKDQSGVGPEKRPNRMGLLQDNDSVGGTNSNPNLHKAD